MLDYFPDYKVKRGEKTIYEVTIRHLLTMRALILKEGNVLIGAMTFSRKSGSIDFLGIHPQYRNQEIQKMFLEELLEKYLPGQEICMTTYREGGKADTGYRD